MSKQNENSEIKSISRAALITFASGSAIVYASALYYCISTENFFAAQLIGAATVLMGAFIYFIYRKM